MTKRGPKPVPAMDRIFPRLEWESECLLWTGPTNNMGYGTIGRRDGGTRLVHRAVAQEHMEVPEVLNVLHSCDTPRCCNPEHLSPGTQAQNIRDCIDRGRFTPRPLLAECKRGHEFSEENTMLRVDFTGKTFRHCRKCATIRMRQHRERQKAKRRR